MRNAQGRLTRVRCAISGFSDRYKLFAFQTTLTDPQKASRVANNHALREAVDAGETSHF